MNKHFNKKIIRQLLTIIILVSSVVSCGDSSDEKLIGGSFKFCSKNRIHFLHPSLISDESTSLVAKQVFEGLVKLNPENLEIEPCLAKEFSFDPKSFVYSFTLKDNIFFHDDKCFPDGKGRKLTVDDIIYTFKNICTKQIVNDGYHNTLKGVVKGVEDYFDGSANEISGIRKVAENKIEIELHRPKG